MVVGIFGVDDPRDGARRRRTPHHRTRAGRPNSRRKDRASNRSSSTGRAAPPVQRADARAPLSRNRSPCDRFRKGHADARPRASAASKVPPVVGPRSARTTDAPASSQTPPTSAYANWARSGCSVLPQRSVVRRDVEHCSRGVSVSPTNLGLARWAQSAIGHTIAAVCVYTTGERPSHGQ